MSLDRAYQRDVDIVVPELVESENPLPEFIIPVQCGEGLVDGFNQARVDALRNVVTVQGGVQCGVESAHARIEDVLLDRSCIEGSYCLLMGFVRSVELGVGTASEVPVGIDHEL